MVSHAHPHLQQKKQLWKAFHCGNICTAARESSTNVSGVQKRSTLSNNKATRPQFLLTFLVFFCLDGARIVWCGTGNSRDTKNTAKNAAPLSWRSPAEIQNTSEIEGASPSAPKLPWTPSTEHSKALAAAPDWRDPHPRLVGANSHSLRGGPNLGPWRRNSENRPLVSAVTTNRLARPRQIVTSGCERHWRWRGDQQGSPFPWKAPLREHGTILNRVVAIQMFPASRPHFLLQVVHPSRWFGARRHSRGPH